MKYLDFENEKTVKTSHALKTVEEDKSNCFISLETVVYNVEAKTSVNKYESPYKFHRKYP